MRMKKILFSRLLVMALLLSCLTLVKAQSIPWLKYEHDQWVDSVMNALTPTQRLAQLFMVAAYSNRDKTYDDQLAEYVVKNDIGGVIFFQGGPVRQARLTNRLQENSKTPLLVAMDAEWGLNMRLDSTMRFPYGMALGAITNQHLIYETGAAIARQCKRLSVQINFAPDVDINNNPENPVINFRSFGEDRDQVAQRGIEYARGMQDNGVLPVIKHFPGHGDTSVDSHLDLPVIPYTMKRLDSLEIYPFRKAINAGAGGVMVAHLSVPAIDSTGIATTLSKSAVTNLLKEKMGFKGLVFTDALNMKGVSKYYDPGVVDLKALLAGNDVLLFSEDVPKAIEQIQLAIKNKQITQQEIDARCRKILALKRWTGLNQFQPIETSHLVEDLHDPADQYLNIQLTQSYLTLLKNDLGFIPIKGLKDLKIASVDVGTTDATVFQQAIDKYAQVDHYSIGMDASTGEYAALWQKLNQYDLIIAGLHNMAVYPKNDFGVSIKAMTFLSWVAKADESIITVFGNPYFLDKVENIEQARGLMVAYQETDQSQSLAAQLIFGGIGADGHLPVSIGEKFKLGDGLSSTGGMRFKYTMPEELGLDSHMLHQRVDSLVTAAIQDRAIPGCQVVVAKDNKVIWHRSYGYQTYDSLTAVQENDLYDLASLTKVSGALPCLMKLYEEGKFDINATLGTYLPYFRHGNKKNITFREILAHQSGMVAWIPYWQSTLRGNASYPWKSRWDSSATNQGKFKWHTFQQDSSASYPIKVTDNMWLYKNYRKKIYRAIRKSKLGEKKYVYSGLTFYLFPQIIANITGEKYTDYLYNTFYIPLGAYTLRYKPEQEFSLDRIVPTEYDSLFRKEQIHGTVHDEGAAMMGGISSNAGLFAEANDLAKLFQMYCNYGEYGGHRFLKEETVKTFAQCQYCDQGNRRALGFDRQLPEPSNDGNTAKMASDISFGHSGFTGTFAWADPKYHLVYVFFSNRVYPTRANTKLYYMNTRTNVQEVFYEAIEQQQK